MRTKEKQITFRVDQNEWRYLLHKAYGYKSFTEYMRSQLLLKEDTPYNLLCKSCLHCDNLKIVGGGCKYLPICKNAIEIHADDSEMKG